jgi:NAD(P)H-flavin reductase
MAEGMIDFTVKKVNQETSQMRLFLLESETTWKFIPGQVAILSPDGKAQSYFAIASAPEDKGGLEFLVRDSSGSSSYFYNLAVGNKVFGKGPVGKGYPIDNYHGRDFIMVAVGSAISPIRSALRSLIQHRKEFGKVALIYGARHSADFPFLKEMDTWRNSNVNVILTASQPDAKWTGKQGHVQAHFAAVISSTANPVVLICGMKAMMEESKAELLKLKVAEKDILTNY